MNFKANLRNALLVIFLSIQFSVMAQKDSTLLAKLDILPWEQTNLKNEICIQNFFPMIFNSWSGGTGVMYRRYFKNSKYALRVRIDGNINNQTRNAFNNNDLAVPIPVEFNSLKQSYSSASVNLGFQYRFVNQKAFSIYGILDYSKGKTWTEQTTMYSQSASSSGKGRTILSFRLNDYSNVNNINTLGYGLGAQFKLYKNISIAAESMFQISSFIMNSSRVDREIVYDITTNSYFENSKIETIEPEMKQLSMQLTPSTMVYLTYKF